MSVSSTVFNIVWHNLWMWKYVIYSVFGVWVCVKCCLSQDVTPESAPQCRFPNIKRLHTYGNISTASLIHTTTSLGMLIHANTLASAHSYQLPSSWLITNRLLLSLTKILATSELQQSWIFERLHFDISNKSHPQTGTGPLIMVQRDLVEKGWWALAVVES